MAVSEQKAREVAEQFIKLHETNFKYEFIGCVHVPRFPDEISVNFHVRNSAGDLLEGPAVVIVNTSTNEARFFGEE